MHHLLVATCCEVLTAIQGDLGHTDLNDDLEFHNSSTNTLTSIGVAFA